MNRPLLLIAICTFALSASALADEVQFTNGDRLTGKIKSAAEGKLTITTDVAGDVTVDLAKVKSFTTTAPIEIHLRDKTVINAPITTAPAGSIQPGSGGGATAPAPISFNQIKYINPPPVKWTGSIAANGLITRGNSNTDNFGLTVDASRRAEQDRISITAGYLYGRQENPDTGNKSTTTDNWFVQGKYD